MTLLFFIVPVFDLNVNGSLSMSGLDVMDLDLGLTIILFFKIFIHQQLEAKRITYNTRTSQLSEG